MRLYLIRHADPDYPRGTITPQGHLEAQALADRLEQTGVDRIFCSPLGRAIHTAEYTAQRLGRQIEIQPWLEELGKLRMPDDAPTASMMAWDVHGHLLRDGRDSNGHGLHPHVDIPGFVEQVQQVGEASDRFLAELGFVRDGGVYRVEQDNRQQVAVFCHGGLGLTWLAHLLMIPTWQMWVGFWLPTSSVTTVLMDERTPGIATPRCLCVGDTSHLYAANLPIQPAGIKANFD